MKWLLMKIKSWWAGASWPRRSGTVAGIAIGAFILGNLLLMAVFWHRTYPNTQVGSQKLGSVNYSQVTNKLKPATLLPQQVTLIIGQQKYAFVPQQLGVSLDSSRISKAVESRSWLPVANLFSQHHTMPYSKVNEQMLGKQIVQLAAKTKQAPVNAQIIVQNNQFKLVPASRGYELNNGAARAAVNSAISQEKSSVRLPGKSLPATVEEASLRARFQDLQAQLATGLSFSYNGAQFKPNQATVISWYAPANGDMQLQDSAIATYVTQLGKTNKIRLQNLNAAVAAAKQALTSKQPLQFALLAVPPGPCSNNTLSQIVLVSISQQHMWVCESGNQVYDSAVTTGAIANGTATPTGTWRIYAKQRNLHLIGPTWDDPVAYWLPFYSDYGFHDSSWQTFAYGDTTAYKTDGSHGCVHLPLAAMAWLYNWSRVGTTVTIQA